MRGYNPSEAHLGPSEMETRISDLYSQVAELVDAERNIGNTLITGSNPVLTTHFKTIIMQVLTAGHKYVATNFEDKTSGQTIQFIHKEPKGEGQVQELITISDGTTNEEVLEVLIDRMNYLQAKFPCRENAIVITKLEESLMWLNKRTADRVTRNVEGKHSA